MSYTDEVNAQIVIALLKANGIRRIIASPGTTNIPITGTVQNDPFFEVYSSVDERSAAYMACGMAHETGEPVVLSCTGATASRNYLPGMTEAYYRKLPVIAITSTGSIVEVGHLLPQCIDRSAIPKDVAMTSVTLPPVQNNDEFWDCEIRANSAILATQRHGGGPVHINLVTSYMKTFNTPALPEVRAIRRFSYPDQFPVIEQQTKVAVFVGAHRPFSGSETESLERFVHSHEAVVLCDQTSSYRGHGRILSALAGSQNLSGRPAYSTLKPDLVIHIGEVSGDYPTLGIVYPSGAPVWRVSEDGELRDRFRNLRAVFEMREEDFFRRYGKDGAEGTSTYLEAWQTYTAGLTHRIPEIPFSNTWIAKTLHDKVPANSVVHFGILNSLRNWNLFEVEETIQTASNVGGFGIDGSVSTLIGAALAHEDRLYFGVIGDLAFFYDLSSIGNRHLPPNLRVLLINNGGGCEFELSTHFGSQFGEQTGDYISAEGHYGSRSRALVKNLTENLGCTYLSADSKEAFLVAAPLFLGKEPSQGPVVLECFTNFEEESLALELLSSIDQTQRPDTSRPNAANRMLNKGVEETVRIMMKTLPGRIKRSLRDHLK